MKRLFKSVMLFAAAAMAFTSCDKDQIAEDIQIENGLHLTITTDKPEAESVDGTRTGMDENGKPYWLPNDKIGVSINLVDQVQAAFENTNKEGRSEKTTFSGNLKSVGSDNVTVYAYYPYTNGFAGSSEHARALINKDQKPTLTSFDGESDILVAKPMTVEFVDGEATAVGMQFKRVSGVLKVVLVDDENLLAGECVSEMSVSADTYLAGYVELDLANSTDLGIYANQSRTVTVKYDDEQYEVGKGATYLNVYPQTLAEKSSLTISANTDNYRIYKNIVLKQNIEIVAGKMTTLNIHIGNDDVSGAESEFESDDIFVCSSDDSTNKVYSLTKNGGDTKFNGKKATGFKLGTTDIAGTFEATTATDVTEDYTLSFYAVGWNNKNVDLTVSVAGKEKTYSLNHKSGAANDAPYTINEVTDADKYTVVLRNLAGGETIKFTTSKGSSNGDFRAVVAGVHLTEGLTEGADDLEESTTEPEPEDPTDGVVVTLPYTLDTTLEANKGKNSGYAGNGDVTVGGVTWNAEGNMTMQPWRIGGSSIKNQDRAVYTKTAMKADVKKIEVAHGTATLTVNSFTVIVAADADFANKLYEHTWKSFAQNSTTTIARPESDDWNGCYYKFVYNVTTIGNGSGNQYVQLSSIRFSDEDGVTTPDETEPETPEPPVDPNPGEGTTTTITFNGGAGQDNGITGTVESITWIANNNGGNDKPNETTAHLRLYAKNELTFSGNNVTIKKIKFNFVSNYIKPLSANVGTYNTETYIWEGSSSSVVFTNNESAQARILSVEVTYIE